jgi:AcrR family transcriptional regulator
MRRIAEKIEYSPTTIYLYFQDKGNLLRSICDETFEKLIVRLDRIKQRATDPLDGLRARLLEYVNFGLANPQHYRVTFMTPGIEPTKMAKFEDPQNPGRRAFEHLYEGVAECVKTGKLRTVDVQTTSQALWAGVHGVTSLLIAQRGFPFVERGKLIDAVINSMVDGLRA